MVTLLGPQLPLLIRESLSIYLLQDGSYLAWAWLHEVVNSTSQSWLDTDASNFTVGNNSTSTGGNNSGGNSWKQRWVVHKQTQWTNCSRIDWNLTVNVTIDDCINGTNSFWFELQNTGGIVWIDPDVAVSMITSIRRSKD